MKTVIFEELKNKDQKKVRRFHAKGCGVYYFRLEKTLCREPWIEQMEKEGSIQKVPFSTLIEFFDGIYETKAFEKTDEYFEMWLKGRWQVDALESIYRKDISLVLKNDLFKKLSRFYYLLECLKKVQEHFPEERNVRFIPSNPHLLFQILDLDVMDFFEFIEWEEGDDSVKKRLKSLFVWQSRWGQVFKRLYLRLKLLGGVCVFPLIILAKGRRRKKPLERKHFKYGCTVSSARHFENGIKSPDFLIDEKKICKEDVVRIPFNALTQEQKLLLDKRKLHYIADVDSHMSIKNIDYFMKMIFPILRAAITSDIDLAWTMFRLTYYRIKWGSLTQELSLDHLLSENTDVFAQAIARDLIFKRQGTKIWKYMDSASLANYAMPLEQFERTKEQLFAYMVADVFVSWSGDNSRIFKTTKSSIGRYLESGCQWSELTRLIGEGKIHSDIPDILRDKGVTTHHKVVSVFDSTFLANSLNPFEDGASFYEDVFRLAEALPQTFFLVKEKKPRNKIVADCPVFEDIFDRLDRHPRIHCVGNVCCPSEIIAYSDLVISFPFASTGLEALGARRKSIWYDVGGKFRDTFYTQCPGLVFHSFEDLLAEANRLLFEVSNEEYNDFLNTRVRDFCCPYFDGLGITRLRALLTGAQLETKRSEPLTTMAAEQ